MITVEPLIPTLQLAIGPVILISAVGLLILTLNNRMAHSVDRARTLARERATVSGDTLEKINGQIDIIYQRARIIRTAMILIIGSALASSILIISLFLSVLFSLDIAWLYGVAFILALGSLIGGLLFFIKDVNNGLEALRIDIGK